ncbi:zinc finger protein 492-like isoform X15 [Maniola hyperantus]|uniref:zinc finger protein 492-like isoform X15 n=1 Tax=Aphantopus hyperantus TaxID=2795564 RepID=UPI00156814F9|nr:zinc finger protein 665-like isoform X10 [Maniola hyperantus]
MEGVLSDGMCRCCATEGSFKDFQVAYQWMGVEEIYGNMLKDCFDITLSVSEEISNGGICEVCITQLRNACNFKQQVQRTEEKFQKKLQEASFKTEGIKMEISRFEDDDSNISADDFSSPEYEVPIKVEKVEEKPKKRAAAKASTSKAKKTKASEGEPSVKRLNQQITIFTGDRADEILRNIQESSVGGDRVDRGNKVEKKNHKGIKQKNLIFFETIHVQEVEKHRNNLLEILVNSNATMIRHRGDQGYVCSFCTEQYPLAADLKMHTLQSHDEDALKQVIRDMRIYTVKLDITSLQCAICQSDMSTIEQLMDHLVTIHKRKIYTDIKNHIIPFKFKDDELKCAICSIRCSTFRLLTEHMNKHYRNYVCDSCGAGFVNRDILRSHLRIHKTGTFKCDLCPKTFDTRIKKTSHINVVHKKSSMTRKCGYCNEAFMDYHKKMEHLHRVHGMKKVEFKCELCNKTYTSHSNLSCHIRNVHLNEREVKCDVCDMTFFSRNTLKMHMLRHTGQRDHHCELCGNTFARRFTLNQHMQVHTKERRNLRRGPSPQYLIIAESDAEADH